MVRISCKKNNIKIGKLENEEDKRWPIDVIFSEIKKYKEKKVFTNRHKICYNTFCKFT